MNRKSYVHQISEIGLRERVWLRASASVVASERRCIGVDRRCRESEGKVKIEGYMSVSDEEAHQREGGKRWASSSENTEENSSYLSGSLTSVIPASLASYVAMVVWDKGDLYYYRGDMGMYIYGSIGLQFDSHHHLSTSLSMKLTKAENQPTNQPKNKLIIN